MRVRRLLPLLAIALATCGRAKGAPPATGPTAPATSTAAAHLGNLTLPPGFHIALYASVPGARSLARGPKGTVFVGTQGSNVYAVRDRDGDGVGDDVITLASGLNTPNGVAFHDGALYVAEVSRITRYDGIEEHLDAPPRPTVVIDTLPTDRSHGWKFIAFGPDGLLYVPIGAPCNLCDRPDPRYASISRLKPDGSGFEVLVRGVRNTVGFDWNPATGQLWFTDNGRDMLGDDVPPDELNRVTKKGEHFGYPYCHGGDISDPEFGKGHPCSDYVAPMQKLGAHVAAIGMRFYRGSMFPAEYKGQIFIAEHGSWNRSSKSGYRVTLVRLKDGAPVSYEPFIQGWLSGEQDWGRPVDVMEMPDGALLVSDDKAGALYRLTYSK